MNAFIFASKCQHRGDGALLCRPSSSPPFNTESLTELGAHSLQAWGLFVSTVLIWGLRVTPNFLMRLPEI